MTENLGDSDNREVFGVYDCLASRGAHALSAHAEEFQLHGWRGDSRPQLSG